MSTVLPPPPPAAFKNRRGWLIAFGIAEILIGCLLLLLMGLTAFAIHKIPASATPPAPDARVMMIGLAMYGVIAVFFVAVGIGTIHARRWARIAMLIVSWAWLAIGVVTTIIMVLLLPKIFATQQGPATPNAAGILRIGEIVMFSILGIFFIILPLVFAIFYSGKNVKAMCEISTPGTSVSKPVPVLIASGWFWLGVLGYLFVFMRPAFPLFGYVLKGWACYAAAAGMEALTIWLAWNLYRQQELAWRVAVAWLIFGWASTLVTIGRYGFMGMYRAMGYADAELSQIVSFTKIGVYSGFAVAAGFLVFLLVTRKYYRQPALAG